MRIASFFAGIGGFELGFKRAGHETVFACEIEPFPRAVYAARFGRGPESEDVRTLQAKEIPEADIWCAGFPCQDVSTAGVRAGVDGERTGLVWRLLELARELRPRWLLLENVPGILSVDRGHGFGRLLAALDDLGYVGAGRVLDAQFFGVPQRRRRVFVLARRAGGSGASPAEILLEREGVRGRAAQGRGARSRVARAVTTRAGSVSQRDGDLVVAHAVRAQGQLAHREDVDTLIIANTVRAGEAQGERGDGADNLVPVVGSTLSATGNRRARVAYALRTNQTGSNGANVSEDASPCLGTDGAPAVCPPVRLSLARGEANGEAGGEALFPHASGVRRLMPVECERLMDFPDGWTDIPGASDSKRYKALGNSVAIPCIEWIARRMPRD